MGIIYKIKRHSFNESVCIIYWFLICILVSRHWKLSIQWIYFANFLLQSGHWIILEPLLTTSWLFAEQELLSVSLLKDFSVWLIWLLGLRLIQILVFDFSRLASSCLGDCFGLAALSFSYLDALWSCLFSPNEFWSKGASSSIGLL